MTLISAIMPATLGGLGKTAFTKGGIMTNLGKLMNIPAMADGGVVMGPQMALIGEAGPEAVIPLDQLKNYGGAEQVEVIGKISGTDIFLSNRNTGTNRQRSVYWHTEKNMILTSSQWQMRNSPWNFGLMVGLVHQQKLILVEVVLK